MKLAFTSDIHVDFSQRNAELLPILVERAAEIAPDVFVIAGDIATQFELFAKTLAAFEDLKCAKLVVPGNHDIWIDSKRKLLKGIDSTCKYFDLLPDVCRDYDFVPLWMEPFCIGNIGFIGSLGWYDYSFRNPNFDDRITTKIYAEGRCGFSMWVDMRRAWWLRHSIDRLHKPRRDRLCKTDDEVCTEMIDSLTKQAQGLAPEDVSRIIAVIHHLPFSYMVKHINDLSWDFFSAFMGSVRIGEALLRDERITHALCGHTHRKVDVTFDHIHALTSPIGYFDEWGTTDARRHVADRLYVLDIDDAPAASRQP
jgi:predicted phosphohydrolase